MIYVCNLTSMSIDIKKMNDIIVHPKKHQAPKFTPYNQIYAITNEMLDVYSVLPLERVLCPATDHVFYSILNGARELVVFDLNLLTKIWLEFKIAAFASLSYDEFWQLFRIIIPNNNANDLGTMVNLVDKVLPYMSSESASIIKQIINENTTQETLYKYFSVHAYEDMSVFLDKDNYMKIKNIILTEDITIPFIPCNISELPDILAEYQLNDFSAIILSNISTYVPEDLFVNILTSLSPHVASDGKMQVGYYYTYIESNKIQPILESLGIKFGFSSSRVSPYPFILFIDEDGIKILQSQNQGLN